MATKDTSCEELARLRGQGGAGTGRGGYVRHLHLTCVPPQRPELGAGLCPHLIREADPLDAVKLAIQAVASLVCDAKLSLPTRATPIEQALPPTSPLELPAVYILCQLMMIAGVQGLQR